MSTTRMDVDHVAECEQAVAMSDLIAKFKRRLQAAGCSPVTVFSRISFLTRADTRLLPHGLDKADSDELADLLANPRWATWTRSTYWSHLEDYYTWAVRIGELAFNPLDYLDRPPAGESTPDPVTEDELRLALDRSPDQPWRMAILLAAFAGLRVGEIARLRRQDVTADRLRVFKTKGGRDRWVETHPLLWDRIKDMPLSGNRAPQYVVQQDGGPIDGARFSSRQHLHWRAIDLPTVHMHRFRHYFATSLLEAGVDIRIVQELMGHRSIVSTQGYTKVVSAQRVRAVRSLVPVLGMGTGPASL